MDGDVSFRLQQPSCWHIVWQRVPLGWLEQTIDLAVFWPCAQNPTLLAVRGAEADQPQE